MSTVELKEDLSYLINYLNDPKILRMILALVKEYQSVGEDVSLTSLQRKELKNRIDQRKKGNTDSYSWDEVQMKLKDI